MVVQYSFLTFVPRIGRIKGQPFQTKGRLVHGKRLCITFGLNPLCDPKNLTSMVDLYPNSKSSHLKKIFVGLQKSQVRFSPYSGCFKHLFNQLYPQSLQTNVSSLPEEGKCARMQETAVKGRPTLTCLPRKPQYQLASCLYAMCLSSLCSDSSYDSSNCCLYWKYAVSNTDFFNL